MIYLIWFKTFKYSTLNETVGYKQVSDNVFQYVTKVHKINKKEKLNKTLDSTLKNISHTSVRQIFNFIYTH